MGLAAVRDLRELRAPVSAEELAAFETDMLAGFVLARASAGLADATIRSDLSQLEQIRAWFGRPLWELEPKHADAYFGQVLRTAAPGTRLLRAQALTTYFRFLELRHRAEIYNLTGRAVECPLDEANRPRGSRAVALRVPPSEQEVQALFAGWRQELTACRKYAPTARNYAAARLMSEVGLRVNEACSLDLADVKWELGRFGKLHVRYGKGSGGSGPKARMVPLINHADRTLRWFIEDVWGHFDDDHTRPGAPLFPSERKHADGSCRRVGDDALAARRAAGGRCPLAARVGRPADPARASPLLRLTALPAWDGPAGHPRGPRPLLGGHHDAVRPRPQRPDRGRLGCRAGAGRQAAGRTIAMRWNLRLAAANRGIWKASELQRLLAEGGLVISAGKMSGLWSGQPASVKLEDLDVICVVLGCGVEELLIPEPDKVTRPAVDQPSQTQAAAATPIRPGVTPKPRSARSLPPA
jgi:integrase/DNA-binding Xre family transcriptional regulator